MAHVMAEAVFKLFPGSKIAIGPSIDTGFYYDLDENGEKALGKPKGKYIILNLWGNRHGEEKYLPGAPRACILSET